MTQPPQQAILARIEQMDTTLAVATALADSGRSLDLDGLEVDMTRLCGALLMLPAGDGQALRPAVAGLLARLEGLSAALLR
ncbi:MAG: hypothetical protein JWP20_1980 [Roseomonas sp.]|jgi:hypothetical protein|nr:hypothetical protein [Roseomonas sp.]